MPVSPGPAHHLPEIQIACADGQRALDLQAEARGGVVGRDAVNDEIVKRLALIPLLNGHARDDAIFQAGSGLLAEKRSKV